jgi:hypothetical protein
MIVAAVPMWLLNTRSHHERAVFDQLGGVPWVRS